ncbi:MAG: LytTR family DNA-binding domain-containing protein [Longibaculum muris]|uniref:LytTR family transcriptional regulator n=1 Tax=Longibaculum muris TaxID=1796628 RepID=A0A4R3Z2P6_9FIRM|nr:LytTR family DNA-binding domain-containing protein [Longibaculum muris]KXU51644.1 LytTr DNA-binding domain protein [Candidatus Stoquefichus sp. KLE1796]MBS5371338.1 LytTR family transcriptional regulator [Coprobacillus cateniformis]MCR1888469.1 LytTR family transcriptional regulator [Longibaculum muris]MED9813412.1 LytTR family DNA-binding domain-containing protein [Longibaculum muris]TCV99319.1 LytTR family transcriptional regulator [Longibaculum muris]
MKIIIEESDDYQENEILIKCQNQNDEEIQRIIQNIQSLQTSLICKKEKAYLRIYLENILYIESIDEKTFLYTIDDVYEASQKLYELEQNLQSQGFLRISKSCILNLEYLQHVRALFNGKYEATLTNNEKLTINRSYVPAFKKAFGL